MARPAMKGKAIVGRTAKQHGASGRKPATSGGRAPSSMGKTMRVTSNGGKACSC